METVLWASWSNDGAGSSQRVSYVKHRQRHGYKITEKQNTSHLYSVWNLNKSGKSSLLNSSGRIQTHLAEGDEVGQDAKTKVWLRWSQPGPAKGRVAWMAAVEIGQLDIEIWCYNSIFASVQFIFHPHAPWKWIMTPFYPFQMAQWTKLYWGIRIYWLQCKGGEIS